jgi:cytochrome c-type biogenesis protein
LTFGAGFATLRIEKHKEYIVLALETLVLPVGLGLLGFIEPCVIGGHLVFIETQKSRSLQARRVAVVSFVLLRAIVTGLFGILVATLGAVLAEVQSGLAVVFGVIYLLIGVAFLLGRENSLKKKITMAPKAWQYAQNPVLLGAAFGLNIPACAAPVLLGLLGMAATGGAVLNAFVMMFLFGFFLSVPLAAMIFIPGFSNLLDRAARHFDKTQILIGLVFVALGLWSVWMAWIVGEGNWAI